jgi:hypothetical protein
MVYQALVDSKADGSHEPKRSDSLAVASQSIHNQTIDKCGCGDIALLLRFYNWDNRTSMPSPLRLEPRLIGIASSIALCFSWKLRAVATSGITTIDARKSRIQPAINRVFGLVTWEFSRSHMHLFIETAPCSIVSA